MCIMSRTNFVVFALVVCAGSVSAYMGDERIGNGMATDNADTRYDPIGRIGVYDSNNNPVIASTCNLIAPGMAVVNGDSTYNTNGQVGYPCSGGTMASQFLRFRRLANGSFGDYDVPILGYYLLPSSIPCEATRIALFDPSLMSEAHIAPLAIEYDAFPSTSISIQQCGYGTPQCGQPPSSARSTIVRYYLTNASTASIYAAPDYYNGFPEYTYSCACAGVGLNCPNGGITGGDSGGPNVMEQNGDLVAVEFRTGLIVPVASAYTKRVLREFRDEPIDSSGTIALNVGKPIATRSGVSAISCLRYVGPSCVAFDIPWNDSVTIQTGVNSYASTVNGTPVQDTRSVTMQGGCVVDAHSEATLSTGFAVTQSSGVINVSVGAKHEKELGLSYPSPTGQTFPNNRVANMESALGNSSSKLMTRVPFTVSTSSYSWLGVRVQGERVNSGQDTVTPQTSDAYWVIIRDNDGDGVVDTDERIVWQEGFGGNGVRTGFLTLVGGNPAIASRVEHVLLPSGDYILEAGLHTNSSISASSTVCGNPATLTGVVNDNVMVTLSPDAPCGTPDFNLDGFVDLFDYDAYVESFENDPPTAYPSPDFNRDGFVDLFDYDAYVGVFEGATACDGSLLPTFVRVFN
jgi:hypothetical protein